MANAPRWLWQLTLISIAFATGVLAESGSQKGVVHLTVPERTIGAQHEDIPAPLRSPLQSLFGAPLSMVAPTGGGGGVMESTTQTAADSDEEVAASSVPENRAIKSPAKALFLSALLPGAGEYYAGNRKRAAIFLGLEALGWALWSTWDSKGNDVVDEFRATAREQWDWKSYVGWELQSNAQRHNSFTHALPCKEFLVIDGIEGLTKCPESEVQQYYELIGKYDQFVVGWLDLQYVDGTGTALPSAVDSVESVSSANRFEYELRRNDSNKWLERASTVSGLILVNHVLSAIDASRVARDTAQGKTAAAIDGRTRFAFTTRDGLRGGAPILLAYKPFY
jgi:hypothetical protein